MTLPPPFTSDTGYNLDKRTLAYYVNIIDGNGNVVPLGAKVLAADWSYAIDRVPTARVVIRAPVPANIKYFTDIFIWAGTMERGVEQVFRGKVLNINPQQDSVIIECAGLSWPLDVTFHKVVVTIGPSTSAFVVGYLLGQAGLTDYVVDLPTWNMATATFLQLEFQTYGEAITKVLEPDGAHWFEDPSGAVHVALLDAVGTVRSDLVYYAPRIVGLAEVRPQQITDTITRPRIRSIQRQEDVRQTKNQIFVKGAVVTTVQGDGTSLSTDITSTILAPSPYVLKPDGSQSYNDFLLTNELVDTQAKADDVAQRYLFLLNRLQQSTTLVVDGDPRVKLARTVEVADPYFANVSGLFFVQAYQSQLTETDFSTSLTLYGGGAALNFKPIAAFNYQVEREVIADRVYVVASFDATPSYDIDGRILTYSWTDNQGKVASTAKAFSVKVDPATLTPVWTVTLTVTDDGGATATLTKTIIFAATEVSVTIPAVACAFDTRASASPDGGQTWNDQALTGSVVSVASSPFGYIGNGGETSIILFGTSLGGLWRSTDYCLSAPTQVLANVGSAIKHIHWDENQASIVWAVTDDGRLYQGADGLAWSLYENLRVKLAKNVLKLTRVDTPPRGGVRVFGGDGHGKPEILHDFAQSHVWTELPLGGNLGFDLNNFTPSQLAIETGQYTGNGASQGISFTDPLLNPDVVIVYAGGKSAVIKAKGWGGTISSLMEGGGALNNGITGISAATFSVGANTNVNAAAQVYQWVAIRHKGGGIGSGSYVGNGRLTEKHVAPAPPVAAWVFGGTRAIVKTGSMVGFKASQLGAAAAFVTTEILLLNGDGFTLNQGTNTNANGTTYYWITWPFDRDLRVDSYPGTGIDNRDILSGAYKYAIIMGDLAQHKVHRGSNEAGDFTHVLQANGVDAADMIQVIATKLQIGGDARVNQAATSPIYHYMLFGQGVAVGGPADLVIADACYRRPNELAIILNSATYTYPVYYTPDVYRFDGTQLWFRAIGDVVTDGYKLGAFIAPDLEYDKFAFGFNGINVPYTGDVSGGIMQTSRQTGGLLDAGDGFDHGLWIALGGGHGFSGAYIIGAEGPADGTIYKTIDRFASIQKLRPAVTFPAAPAGGNAKMVAIGPSPKGESLYVQQSPWGTGSPQTYAARVANYTGAQWTLQSNPASVSQDAVTLFKRLGANLYRILGDGDANAIYNPGQLQRSTDNGVNWSNVGPAPIVSAGLTWGVTDVDIGADGVLWLCAGCFGASGDAAFNGTRIYKSTDTGANWVQVYEDATKDGGIWRRMMSISCHPTNKNVLAAIANVGAASTCSIYVTTNGGGAFTRNTGGAGNASAGRQVIMLDNNRLVGLMATIGDLYYSDDYGVAWSNTLASAGSTQQYQVLRADRVLFVTGGSASDPQIQRSDDYGSSWNLIVQETLDAGSNRIVGMAYSPRTQTLYACLNSTTTSKRVYAINNPFDFNLIATPRQLTTYKDLTVNLDSLFTAPLDTIGRLGIAL